MNSTVLEYYLSDPEHPLTLKDVDVIGEDALCFVCNESVIGYPTYTSTSDDIHWEGLYLHKSCAELPTEINHHKHRKHPLTLIPGLYCVCDVCGQHVKLFTYTCDDCKVVVCVFCAFEPRVFHHEGHQEHTLTLMPRKALFHCDACGEEAKDSSYVCTTCDFWIHETCALSPFIIPSPAYHHHPLNLVYSIPQEHRYFDRFCAICEKLVRTNFWLYYCHKCTYLVHMKCATSWVPMLDEIEADGIDNEADLVQFPLPSEESLLELIITHFAKLQAKFEVQGENSNAISIIPDDPHIIEEHWSHKNHPLEQLQFAISDSDNEDDNDDRGVLICDGCIQPITAFHPSYYACIQCGFFLHSFCATKLPQQLPAGASPFHPQHELLLQMRDRFLIIAKCGACGLHTNGFYYHCETCDIEIDIRCAFLPARIKHISHKKHSLVQRPFSNSSCSVSRIWINSGMEYACETCNNFRIHIRCAFYPSRIKHRFDLHPMTLTFPLFFYEGVFYCEICEEQVDNQKWLYHCDECDHSFHCECFRWYENVKLGETIKLNISNEPHTLALVLKKTRRKNPLYYCSNCPFGGRFSFFYECDGCGLLLCCKCVREKLGK